MKRRLLVGLFVILSSLQGRAAVLQIAPVGAVEVGQRVQLSATGAKGRIKWSSSHPAIATVDANGLLTAVAEGQSTITARSGSLIAMISVVVLSQFLYYKPGEVTEFYVDFGRTSNGDGSEANPWKERNDINWSTIATALETSSVTIYFSSRANWTAAVWTYIPEGTNENGSNARILTLDGQSYYNSVASGTASWQAETDPSNRATFTTTVGQSGGPIVVLNNNGFITIRGFHNIGAANGPISLGESNPTTGIHDIIVENNVLETPQAGHGVWFGFAETGCYNITIRNNTIIETVLEGIYIGHYNYLSDTITGVIVEGNILIDTGTDGEGEIDIKPPAFGAIVRYNTVYSTGGGGWLAGIVVGASDVQIYGNALYDLVAADPIDGGSGIQINADGADGTGKDMANLLVYNNLIYGNEQAGVRLFANLGSITNLKFLNNTIVGNGMIGFQAGASGGEVITIAAFSNNVFKDNAASSGSYEIDTNSGVTISAANHNAIYHAAGGTFLRYQGVDKSWAQWQALGFDADGLNVDPQLNGTTYYPSSGASPLVGAGEVRGEFSIDKAQVTRGASWDIGAYEF